MIQQDDEIRKLTGDIEALRQGKADVDLQLSRLKETTSETERRNDSLRREIDILS